MHAPTSLETAQLSPGSRGRIDQVLRILANVTKACKFASMYPGGHRKIDTVQEIILQDLQDILEKTPTLTLSTITRRLSVNGIPIQDLDSPVQTILKIIDNLNVESIQFEKGVTLAEIAVLTRLFSLRPSDVLVGGRVADEHLQGLTHIRINKLKLGILKGGKTSALEKCLHDIFDRDMPVESAENAISMPMSVIESLVDGLAQCCKEAMDAFHETGDSERVRSITRQCFYAVMPLLMSKDLGDVRHVSTRILDTLGEDGLELIVGEKVTLAEAVHLVLKGIPLEKRSAMLLDEVRTKVVDPLAMGQDLVGIFNAEELGDLARLGSDRVIQMNDRQDNQKQWEFLEKFVGSFSLAVQQPSPLALFLFARDLEGSGALIEDLNKLGVSCIVLKSGKKILSYAESFQPPFILLDVSQIDDPKTTLIALRSLCPASYLHLQNLDESLFSEEERDELYPCHFEKRHLFCGRILDLTLQTLKIKEPARVEESPDVVRAREIQLSLLPEAVNSMEPYQVSYFYEPCLHVGGDYYDIIEAPNGERIFAVADVCGKGSAAAMLMVMIRSVLRMLATQGLPDDQLVKALNRHMAQDLKCDLFVAVSLLFYHPQTDSFSHYRAGQEPLIRVKSDGQAQMVREAKGMAIGMADVDLFEKTLKPVELKLEEGEFLFVSTDGTKEAMNENHEEFGNDRLLAVLQAARQLQADLMVQKVVESVVAFEHGAPRHDDITLLIIKKQLAGAS
ncbi:MAG: serine/threonine-protein phosphatase [Planctomycetes bacterium]|nr:serine/threonine-protein phosphatase [Planctomycetota bacterium]